MREVLRPNRRSLYLLLFAAVLVVLSLLGLQLRDSYRETIRAAETTTLNYAAMLEARLDATLRRADAVLQGLAPAIPAEALSQASAPRYADRLNAGLDAHLVNFEELACLRVFDGSGNLLYTGARESTPPMNISDRDYFRTLRDDPQAGLVFSEVMASRATGRKTAGAARALRDGSGDFRGIVMAAIELEHFERLFQTLDTGPHGLVSIRRSDDFSLVVRWPVIESEINKTVPPSNPLRAAISAGTREATVEFGAMTDDVTRIFSFHALERYPFYVVAALARDDVLSGWRKRSVAVAGAGLLLLCLLTGLLWFLWRTEVREARVTAELAESGQLLRDAQLVAGLGAYDLDIANGVWESSDILDGIFGIDATFERSVAGWASLIHPDDRATMNDYLTNEVVGKKQRFDREYRIIRKRDGAVRWLHGQGRLEFDARQVPIRMIGTIQDITDRRAAEAALRQSEERFQQAMRGANDGLWDWNLATDEVYYSPRWESMLGYETGELEHRLDTWKRLVHPEDRERILAVVQALLDGRCEKFDVEFRMRHKDGSCRHILSRAFLVDDAAGKHQRLVGTHVDITERKRAEEKLRQSEQFVRSILDTVDEGFIVVDRDYRILTANTAYCNQSSRSCDEVIGRRCHEISHRISRPCFEAGEECPVRQVFETGQPHAAVHKHPGRNGQVLFVETKAFPIKDASGNTTSVIETLNNITEKHLLEEERLKTQKLESIGTLAGGIAHDFNNLLQGIFGYISMAKLCIDQRERSLAMIEQAEQALHQSVSLTTQLLTFSKGGKPVREPIALEPVIENAVKFALSGSSTEYRLAFDPALRRVDADAGQLGQVIQNIVMNADQAMPGGGCVEIAARNVPPADPELPQGLPRRDHVMISISDCGVGIPEKDLDRIFDPYFTTKERGSGLGLATSYSIVRNHEGRIFARSAAGRGSTFSICLPASEAVVEAPQPTTVAAGTRAARILVMDDEEVIRNVAGEVLAVLGHTVVSADRGERAIEAFQTARDSGRPFDLVILDLTVRGGMGGVETVGRLLEIDPALKAVASSGYSDDATLSNFHEQGFAAFLKKPYSIAELQGTLSRLLG